MIWLFIKRGGGLAFFLALFAVVALYAGVAQSGTADEFADAEVVQAKVVALKKSARMQSGSTKTDYYVTVSMPSARQHRASVSGRFYSSLKKGQEIPVRVLKNPPRYEVEPGRMEESSLWAVGMSVLLGLGAGALTVFAWRNASRELAET